MGHTDSINKHKRASSPELEKLFEHRQGIDYAMYPVQKGIASSNHGVQKDALRLKEKLTKKGLTFLGTPSGNKTYK